MDRTSNLEHWERWANDYGTELRATTKCVSIKRLEIEALLRRVAAHCKRPDPLVVEVGCGNGANGFALASRHAGLAYVGLDFSPAMVVNALAVAARRASERGHAETDRLAFGVADARELAPPVMLDATRPHGAGPEIAARLPSARADVVFTDRMLINLASAAEQLGVMRRIAELLAPGGLFLMIENSAQTHRRLNEVRATLGLSERRAAEYNVFIDEPEVIAPFAGEMDLIAVDDFGAIHDLMLYAIEPALNGGEVSYDSPLVTACCDAILALQERGLALGDGFGQNRLWVFRR